MNKYAKTSIGYLIITVIFLIPIVFVYIFLPLIRLVDGNFLEVGLVCTFNKSSLIRMEDISSNLAIILVIPVWFTIELLAALTKLKNPNIKKDKDPVLGNNLDTIIKTTKLTLLIFIFGGLLLVIDLFSACLFT